MKDNCYMVSHYFETNSRIKNSFQRKSFIFRKQVLKNFLNRHEISNSFIEKEPNNLNKKKIFIPNTKNEQLSIRSCIYSPMAMAIYRKLKIETSKSRKISLLLNSEDSIINKKKPKLLRKEEICLNVERQKSFPKLEENIFGSEIPILHSFQNDRQARLSKRDTSCYRSTKIKSIKKNNLISKKGNIKLPVLNKIKNDNSKIFEENSSDLYTNKKLFNTNKENLKSQFDRLIHFNMIEYLNDSLLASKIQDRQTEESKKQVGFKF